MLLLYISCCGVSSLLCFPPPGLPLLLSVSPHTWPSSTIMLTWSSSPINPLHKPLDSLLSATDRTMHYHVTQITLSSSPTSLFPRLPLPLPASHLVHKAFLLSLQHRLCLLLGSATSNITLSAAMEMVPNLQQERTELNIELITEIVIYAAQFVRFVSLF